MKRNYTFILAIFTFLFSYVGKSQAPTLWGLTANGAAGFGSLFSITTGSTSFASQFNFDGVSGIGPQFEKFIQATNGKLYGTTATGGSNNLGVLFEYNPATNTYTKLVDFAGTATGSNPQSSLLQAANGNLYGMTRFGGTNNLGVIFEYNLSTSTFTKKIDMLAATGSQPFGSLIQAANGKLYGVTRLGGANALGTLFEYEISTNTYTVKVDFSAAIGSQPQATPIEASNGKLYGTTILGGTNNVGTIYEYDYTTNVYTKKIDCSLANGSQPYASLLQASNGKLYGTTNVGGANNLGVIYDYDYGTNIYTKLFDMTSANGGQSQGSLIQASNGNLFGLTRIGGANNLGALFEFNITGSVYTKRVDFSTTNGTLPLGAVLQATNGVIYGMTSAGGANAAGVIFDYNIGTNTFTKKLDLNTSFAGQPLGSLLHASNDKMYGLATTGGTNNAGAIFEYNITTNTYSKTIDLSSIDGSSPNGALMEALNGKMYGMTKTGGTNNLGVIFEYDFSTNTYVKKIDLSAAGGNSPSGSLIQASNGKLYGLTNLGGANNLGSLFDYDIGTNTFTKDFDFVAASGSNPFGSLVQASNGKLYGLTRNGGVNSVGTLFEYVISTNTYSKVVDMSAANGSFPQGSLIQATNGKLYGLTQQGGANSAGVLFEFDPSSNTYTKLVDLVTVNGRGPLGSLRQASNGKLYGLTQIGGANNLGVVFEYDITTNTYTKKMDLSGATGYGPSYTQLVEVCRIPLAPGAISSFSTLCQSTPGSQSFSVAAVASATSYAWSFPAGASITSGATTNSPSVDFSSVLAGTYTVGVAAVNICGTSTLSVKSITVLPSPTITVNSGAICSGSAFTINPLGANTYTISGGSTVVSPTVNSSYTVNGTSTDGCISTSAAVSNVTVNALPIIGVNSGAICFGASFTLSATGANTYTYSGGSSVVSPTTNSSYSVTGTSIEGCVSSSAAVSNITVNALPVLSVNSGSICFGLNFTINPSGALTYTYSGGSQVVSPASNTNYSVTGTDGNGCVSLPVVSSVNVVPLPIINVNSGAICSGAIFTMVPSGAATYTFSNGSNTVSPLSNSSYSVTGTSSVGCLSAAPAVSNVTVNPLPVISVNSGTICSGSSFIINPSGASTYTYSGGSSVVSPTATTNYSVTGTSSLGCVSPTSAISSVTVYARPVITVNSGTICLGNSFTMNPSGASTYTYSSGTNIVAPVVSSAYTVIGTSSLGCVSAAFATANVTVISLPIITVNSGAICSGATFTMIPGGAASYTFSNGSNTVSPITNTSYSVMGTSSVGCVSAAPAIANVTVNALPIISVNSGSICLNNSFTLNPSGASTYTYSSGSNIVTPTISTSYSVTGTNSLGCVSSSPAVSNVTVVQLPVVTVNSGTICATNSFTMIPGGASTYTFSSGTNIVSPTTTTFYTVIGTSSVGCISSNTAISNVTVYARPVISVNSGSICAGKNFTMNPSGAATYTYSGGTNVVSPATTTFYTVVGTSSLGCISSNTAISNVTVIANPIISVNSGSICSGNVFTMTPSGAATYTFYNGTNTVSPVVNTSYSVTGTSSVGCISPTPAVSNVTVVALPNVLISGTNSVCKGSSVVLTASGAQTYSWNTGATTASISVTPSVISTYSVVGLANTGCSKITALAINVVPLPTVTAVGGAICPGNSFTLSPSGALTYTYSSGSAVVFPTGTTSYSITGSDANGCISANPAVVVVSVVNTLTVTVAGNNTLCIGESSSLIANGASTYTWSQGSTTNTVVLTPTVTTNYTVIGSSGSCSDTTNVTVIVNPLPILSVSSTASVICLNESVEVTASGATTYTWSTQQNGNTILISPTVTTTFTVYGTDANNCSNSAVITQSVSDCIGIPDRLKESELVSIYPNPNTGEFFIDLSHPAEVSISTVLGQLIYQSKLVSGIHTMDLNRFNNGIYFITVKQGSQSKSVKMIKQ